MFGMNKYICVLVAFQCQCCKVGSPLQQCTGVITLMMEGFYKVAGLYPFKLDSIDPCRDAEQHTSYYVRTEV